MRDRCPVLPDRLIEPKEIDGVGFESAAIRNPLSHVSIAQVAHQVRTNRPSPTTCQAFGIIDDCVVWGETWKLKRSVGDILLQISSNKKTVAPVWMVVELKDGSIEGRRTRRGKRIR